LFDKHSFVGIDSHILILIKERKKMANPNKFKSVSVPIDTYKKLSYLADGKFLDAKLTISKTIEALATRAAKKTGYKNGKV
jgi:hypothetical protein